MKVAVTGATGFVGGYLLTELNSTGHRCRAWHRPTRQPANLRAHDLEWIPGQLDDPVATEQLVQGCDAVIHAALDRPGPGFRGAEGSVIDFAERNLIGSLRLIEAARAAGVGRFVLISSCAVHERILADRPLDESHPTWPESHYGAHKAALEAFVHSYGWGSGYSICALRPTGIYGIAQPVTASKWYSLVDRVVRGETVACQRGGKEVHVADVARAAVRLLSVESIAGECFNCYDRYVSEFEVAELARELSGSEADIQGAPSRPRHEIETGKLRSLGVTFGGQSRLRATVEQLVQAIVSRADAASTGSPSAQPKADQ